MAFDYDKIKKRQEAENHWASYSDLFMVLSVVFLLLYVTSSLNNGTHQIQKAIEVQKLAKKAKSLEQQIKVYDTLKEEKLEEQDPDEQKLYKELMGKLDLLQEKAKLEKEELMQQAQANDAKAQALNKYQQMVRNIINANILAKGQIVTRDKVIDRQTTDIAEKEQEIQEQSQQINQLADTIENRESELAQNKQNIKEIQSELKEKIQKLKQSQGESEELSQSIKELRERSQQQIDRLESQNRDIEGELAQSKTNLAQIKEESEKERERITQELAQAKSEHQAKTANLKEQFKSQMESEKAQLEAKIKEEKLGAEEQAKALAEFRKKAKAKEDALQDKLSNLDSDLQSKENELEKANLEKQRAVASLKGLENDNKALSDDLAKAKALINARKDLANKLAKNFQRKGVRAKVDPKTGDVTIDFKDSFDTGKSALKGSMKEQIKELMPVYTSSLFSDEKTAELIKNVELVGFASPTYKGKYVNPESLKAQDQEAVNYNLKLSFERANSIFKYIFDKKKVDFKHQRDLLPKTKVVGRGYLPEGKKGSEIPEGLSQKEFCAQYDCAKAQKVIIKFTLKGSEI